jgi:hypothetical protein
MRSSAPHSVHEPLRYRLGRARAALWRFRTLAYAERLFAGAPHPSVVERPFFGYRLCLDVSRSNAQRLLYLEGERFLVEAPLLKSLLAPGMHVVDVGANIGYYLLFLARQVGLRGTITCIEPEPDNLIELERNLQCNGPLPAHLHATAAGAEQGRAMLAPGINGSLTASGPRTITVAVHT